MKAEVCLLCRRKVKLGYREIVGEDFEYTCRSCSNKQAKAMQGRLKLVSGLFK